MCFKKLQLITRNCINGKEFNMKCGINVVIKNDVLFIC